MRKTALMYALAASDQLQARSGLTFFTEFLEEVEGRLQHALVARYGVR